MFNACWREHLHAEYFAILCMYSTQVESVFPAPNMPQRFLIRILRHQDTYLQDTGQLGLLSLSSFRGR